MRFIHYITKNFNNIVHVFYRSDFQSRFLKIYRCACVDNALKAVRYYSMAMHLTLHCVFRWSMKNGGWLSSIKQQNPKNHTKMNLTILLTFIEKPCCPDWWSYRNWQGRRVHLWVKTLMKSMKSNRFLFQKRNWSNCSLWALCLIRHRKNIIEFFTLHVNKNFLK